MKRKQLAIGETTKYGDTTVKCVEPRAGASPCCGCYLGNFATLFCLNKAVFECRASHRKDGKDVIFAEVKA
jgi:hypothetical protein